jgi:hypothetical protein
MGGGTVSRAGVPVPAGVLSALSPGGQGYLAAGYLRRALERILSRGRRMKFARARCRSASVGRCPAT